MENNMHKGSEFKNITDTWDENEKKRTDKDRASEDVPATGLDQVIKQEAAAYDNENKEEQLLQGDRATINDDVDADDSGE